MRKKGLKRIFEDQIWNENRIKLANLQNEGVAKALNKIKIPDQIMVTPHTTPQDYDNEIVKMENVNAPQNKVLDNSEVDVSSLRKSLTTK